MNETRINDLTIALEIYQMKCELLQEMLDELQPQEFTEKCPDCDRPQTHNRRCTPCAEREARS